MKSLSRSFGVLVLFKGMMGALTNIDQEGFASTAFHSFPSKLDWDSYSGDYGPNFFGHSINTATYVIHHDEFGWQAFGGNIEVEGGIVKVLPLDSFRKRVFIAPLGLWLTLDAGTFEAIKIDTVNKIVELGFSPSTPFTQFARLRIEHTSKIDDVGEFNLKGLSEKKRGAFVIPLNSGMTWVRLK